MAVVRAFRSELCGLLIGEGGSAMALSLAGRPLLSVLLMGPTPPGRGDCR
jgi:hypothetical protein